LKSDHPQAIAKLVLTIRVSEVNSLKMLKIRDMSFAQHDPGWQERFYNSFFRPRPQGSPLPQIPVPGIPPERALRLAEAPAATSGPDRVRFVKIIPEITKHWGPGAPVAHYLGLAFFSLPPAGFFLLF
jgi:hypothetical protein